MIDFKGKTHALIAVSLYIFLYAGTEPSIPIVISIVLGSLFPDIDIETSRLGRYNLFARFMEHRGRMHTALVLVFISLFLFIFDAKFSLGFAFGYLMHLIMDSFTPKGIMWLYPYSDKYYALAKKPIYRTIDPIIVFICSAFIFIMNYEIIMYSFLALVGLKIFSKIMRRKVLRF